jgi:hypothetical protein
MEESRNCQQARSLLLEAVQLLQNEVENGRSSGGNNEEPNTAGIDLSRHLFFHLLLLHLKNHRSILQHERHRTRQVQLQHELHRTRQAQLVRNEATQLIN